MNAAHSRVVRAEPNVTPMIDVMLVLLVIFMIVVPNLVTGTVPPEGENLTSHPEAPEDRTLVIQRDGRYFLNKRPVSADALPAALRTMSAERPNDHVLYLKADRNLEYGIVRDVLTIAGAAGIRVVGMVSEKAPRSNVETRR